jgi:hypothetical protein
MNFFKFEFLPSNFLLRKLFATLWLNLAGLVDDDVIICVWKFDFNAGVKTTRSIAIEKSEAKAVLIFCLTANGYFAVFA